jgi:hypothetical protein
MKLKSILSGSDSKLRSRYHPPDTDDLESVGMFKSETETLDFQGRSEHQ